MEDLRAFGEKVVAITMRNGDKFAIDKNDVTAIYGVEAPDADFEWVIVEMLYGTRIVLRSSDVYAYITSMGDDENEER